MTANQQYRKYKKEGGTLSFAEYIDREKKKKFANFDGTASVPTNKPLSDSIQKVLNKMHQESGLTTELEGKYILGIHRNVWIAAGVVVVGISAYVMYKNKKK